MTSLKISFCGLSVASDLEISEDPAEREAGPAAASSAMEATSRGRLRGALPSGPLPIPPNLLAAFFLAKLEYVRTTKDTA